jgi:hypothetical protein
MRLAGADQTMTEQKPRIIFLDANILFSAAYGMIASHYVVEEARRNLEKANQRIALEKCLSQVKLVPEADPEMACPVPLPEKDRPVLMAAIIARADCLVTGDLLHFGPFLGQRIQGVMICRLRDLN